MISFRSGYLTLLLLFVLRPGLEAATPAAPGVLISLDAFRWDYIASHPDETPHLRELMRTGVTAKALISVFPTQTFASHYSIATGLYPGHHGLVGNLFFDAMI